MEFEWDEDKSRINKDKHGVSFEEAQSLWDQAYLEKKEIARSLECEDRFATIGWIAQELYVAIWTRRNDRIRFISVRRARTYEKELYNQSIQNDKRDG